ncbi:SPOR domain-containing protein [soil metagenome]
MLLRVLIVLLACMNLGVALWWGLHRDLAPMPHAAAPTGVGSLILLGETSRPQVSDAAELSSEPEPPLAQGSACISLGPFDDAVALRTAMNTLLPKVERIQYREVAATVLKGYRVFLPPAASHADALEVARTLSARGVSDYYVVTAGEQKDSVALGNFRELANATARREAITALGFTPSVEAHTEPATQWWIDLAAAPGFDWKAALAEPASGTLAATNTACR